MQEPQEDKACVIHPHPDAGEVFDMDVEVGAVELGVNAEYFPHAARVYDGGLTFMDQFDTDPFSALRTSAKPGVTVQCWPVLDSVIVFIVRVHLWSTVIALSQCS